MRYTVKNMTLADYVIQTSAGKSVTIKSRSSTKDPVDLSDRTVARTRRTRGIILREAKADVVLLSTSSDAGDTDAKTTTDLGDGADTAKSKSTELSQSDLAKELLAEYRDEERSPPLEYHEFVTRAKAIVGADKWPNGTPKKSTVISLLENVITE